MVMFIMQEDAATFRQFVIDHLDNFVYEHFTNMIGQKVKLTSYQHDFIKDVLERKWNKYIMLSSTRIGKTEANSILAVLMAILYDGEEVVNIAPKFKQADIMFKRIKTFIMNDPRLYSFVDVSRGFRRDEINLMNGSVLRCLSASVEKQGESLLGFGATTLLVDEAGSIPDDVFKTRIMRMTAASRIKNRTPIMILIGTPHVMNHFYESWCEDEFRKYKVTWEDGVREGILDKTEVEYYRKRMSDVEFDTWFNANFNAGDDALYDSRVVKNVMVANRRDRPSPDYDYYFGVDIARFGSDETCITVLASPKGVPVDDAPLEMVNEYCRAKQPVNDTVGFIKDKFLFWNPRLVAVDEIGVGGGVMDLLKEVFGERVVGLKMMGDERVNVYINLRDMMEAKRLSLLSMDKLAYQFRSFTINYSSDGKRKIGKNRSARDDMVDSLAFACWLMRTESPMLWSLHEEMYKGLDSALGGTF